MLNCLILNLDSAQVGLISGFWLGDVDPIWDPNHFLLKIEREVEDE